MKAVTETMEQRVLSYYCHEIWERAGGKNLTVASLWRTLQEFYGSDTGNVGVTMQSNPVKK